MASATTGPYWNDSDDPTKNSGWLETDNKFPPLSFPCFYMTMNEQKIKMTTLTNPTDEHGRNWNFRSRRSSCPFAARRVWMQEYQRREGIKCMSWCIADAPCLCGKCAKGSMSTTH